MKPYWGKPTVRNFRGGDGNVGIIRSPVRAIALPDRYDLLLDPTETSDLLTGMLTLPQANALSDLKATVTSLRGWASEPSCP